MLATFCRISAQRKLANLSKFAGRSLSTSHRCLCESGKGGRNQESSQTGDGSGHDAEEETRSLILESALKFVPEHGWSRESLTKGAEAVGLPSVTHGLFPRGGIELVNHFYVSSNQKLADQLRQEVETLEADGQPRKKTGLFIRDAVQERLVMILPHIDNWPQAMGMMALPPNAPEALRNLGQLMDDIWYHAGDRSVDFNWYTKRASLAAVYKSTELYMIQDNSPERYDTWEFLDRRLADLTSFGKSVRSCQGGSGKFNDLAQGAFTVGLNILGLGSRSR